MSYVTDEISSIASILAKAADDYEYGRINEDELVDKAICILYPLADAVGRRLVTLP